MPLPTNRTNNTPALDIHPTDHNDTNTLVNNHETRISALEPTVSGHTTSLSSHTTTLTSHTATLANHESRITALEVPGTTGAISVVAATADQTLASLSTAFQNLTNLRVQLAGNINHIWFSEIFLVFNTANTTMDFKTTFTVPTGCTGYFMLLDSNSATGAAAWGSANTPAVITGLTTPIITGSAAGLWGVSLSAMIFDGGTAGNVQLQGAQNISNSGSIVLKKGSFIRITKLN